MDADERKKVLALARRLKALGTSRRPRRVPRQRHPDHIAAAYYSAMLDVLRPMREMVESALLPPLRTDAAGAPPAKPKLEAKLKRAEQQFDRRLQSSQANLERLAQRAARSTAGFQLGQLRAQMRAAIGVELPIGDKGLTRATDRFVRENVALIKTVPERYFAELSELVREFGTSGMRHETMADQIRERYDVAESNALRIARDQVGKFNAGVNRTRQVEAGITHYIWRTMNDGRVRDEHADLDGESFAWDSPPAEGEPGEAGVQCRCYAEPDFSRALSLAA